QRVLVRRWGRRRGNPMGSRLTARLRGDKIVVIIAADSTVGAGDDKATLRLRLKGPWISECAPTRFELGQSLRVTRHDDAVLVHLEALWLIHGRGYFDGPPRALIPGAERRAVAEVIQQRTAATRL